MSCGGALIGISLSMSACSKVPETKEFTFDPKTRQLHSLPMIWYENRSSFIVSLESRAFLKRKSQSIGPTLNFPPGRKGAFTHFGSEAWRESMPFNSYSIRLMRLKSKNIDAAVDLWLLDIPFSKGELNLYQGKDIQLDFYDSYVIVSKQGKQSRLPYKAAKIPAEN